MTEGEAIAAVEELPEVPHPAPDLDREWWDRSAMTEGAIVHPVRDDQMLFIHKKRGVGAGNLIGPGGKLEPGETPAEAGRREVLEETGLTVGDLRKVGELAFVFGEDPFMLPHVYVTREFSGRPRESEEGIPEWHAVEDLPFGRMWDDDRYWVPYMLAGERFVGRFRFDADGEDLLAGEVRADVEF